MHRHGAAGQAFNEWVPRDLPIHDDRHVHIVAGRRVSSRERADDPLEPSEDRGREDVKNYHARLSSRAAGSGQGTAASARHSNGRQRLSYLPTISYSPLCPFHGATQRVNLPVRAAL
jgi:hypothetical protein